jgi:hypothetical protein
MDLSQAYAGYSYREGVTRAHVIAAVTKDPKTNEQALRLVIFSP